MSVTVNTTTNTVTVATTSAGVQSITGTAPITVGGTAAIPVIGITQASLVITESQVTNLVSDLALKAPLASPTFTGTVSGITATMVGLGSVDNTADTAKPVSTAQQTALDLKAPIASPTFTGVVTIPASSVVTGLMTITASADAVKGLIVKGFSASQSANIFEIQKSDGTIYSNFTATGGLETTGGLRFYTSAARAGWSTLANTSGNLSFNYPFSLTDSLSVTAGAAGTIAIKAKGAASQTANLFEAQNSSSTVLWAVSSAGVMKYVSGNTASTVGAAGGASALPATPTGYLVIDIGGTSYKVPYFAN